MVAPFVKRPTSPLHFEPIVVPSEDLLYLGSDEEDTPDRRHHKKQRIEELGQKYLEGKPLFIQSASLRGPLHKGWVNPWANKRVGTKGALGRPPERSGHTTTSNNPTAPRQVNGGQRNPARDVQRSLTSDQGQKSTSTKHDGSATDRVPSAVASDDPTRISRPSALVTGHTSAFNNFNLTKPISQKHALPPVHLPNSSAGWLKTDKSFLNAHPEGNNARLSTPTPTARSSPPTALRHGFTPINKRATPVRPVTVLDETEPSAGEQRSPITSDSPSHAPNGSKQAAYREINLTKSDRLGHVMAKRSSQEAAQKAMDEDGHIQAKRPCVEATLRGSQKGLRLNSKPSEPLAPPDKHDNVAIAGERPSFHTHKPKATPHELPPSTNLAEFQYRLASKRPASSSEKAISCSNPFAQQMKAAKAKAEARSTKRLSFTASGGIKNFSSRSTSRASSVSPSRSNTIHDRAPIPSEEGSCNEAPSRPSPAMSKEIAQEPSDSKPQEPEAQQVPIPSGQLGAVPSGPSLNAFEPPCNGDEDDSYLNLSTQAAITKAQHSIQNHIVSPLNNLLTHPNEAGTQMSPTAAKTPAVGLHQMPLSLTKPDVPNPGLKTPATDRLSTQAMMDAISPFAVTSVKRPPISPSKPSKLQKQTSFAPSPLPSPSHTFGTTRRSLSMSTSSDSPSPVPQRPSTKYTYAAKPPPILSKTSTGMSRPLSTATSTAFSIAPNGTLTEVHQQDGQQPYDIGMNVGLDGWDLDEAIEEAGSFLATGAWDVETEARKGGSVATKASGH